MLRKGAQASRKPTATCTEINPCEQPQQPRRRDPTVSEVRKPTPKILPTLPKGCSPRLWPGTKGQGGQRGLSCRNQINSLEYTLLAIFLQCRYSMLRIRYASKLHSDSRGRCVFAGHWCRLQEFRVYFLSGSTSAHFNRMSMWDQGLRVSFQLWKSVFKVRYAGRVPLGLRCRSPPAKSHVNSVLNMGKWEMQLVSNGSLPRICKYWEPCSKKSPSEGSSLVLLSLCPILMFRAPWPASWSPWHRGGPQKSP